MEEGGRHKRDGYVCIHVVAGRNQHNIAKQLSSNKIFNKEHLFKNKTPPGESVNMAGVRLKHTHVPQTNRDCIRR